jgi:Tol biopolymer transport system component
MIWRVVVTAAAGLVTFAGPGHDAAVEPPADIAFASRRDGNWEICVMDAAGRQQRRLTRRSAEDRFPLWSPDGRQIAFSSLAGAGAEDSWGLWLMNADGTGQRRLASHVIAKSTRGWSPDGKRIVLTAMTANNVDIHVVDVQTGQLTRLTSAPGEDRDPSWSPDGRQLVFSSSREGLPQVYVMGADGSHQRRLTNQVTAVLAPRWSPDGALIAFTSGPDGNRDLYLMNATGGTVQRLTKGTHLTRDPAAWSPDGSRIAVQIADGKDYNVGIVRPGNAPRAPLLVASSPAYDGSFTWSPDGKHLAFISDRDGFDAVHVTDAEGRNPIRLTESASLTPAWGSQR